MIVVLLARLRFVRFVGLDVPFNDEERGKGCVCEKPHSWHVTRRVFLANEISISAARCGPSMMAIMPKPRPRCWLKLPLAAKYIPSMITANEITPAQSAMFAKTSNALRTRPGMTRTFCRSLNEDPQCGHWCGRSDGMSEMNFCGVLIDRHPRCLLE